MVIHRHDASQGVGAEVLDESFQKAVTILEQKLFELVSIRELASIRQDAAGIHRWILALAFLHPFVGAPLTDRVVLIKRQAERVNIAMTGGAIRILRVRFQLLANRCLGTVRWIRFNWIDVRRRWWRGSV